MNECAVGLLVLEAGGAFVLAGSEQTRIRFAPGREELTPVNPTLSSSQFNLCEQRFFLSP